MLVEDYSNQAEKFLRKIDDLLFRRIDNKIQSLRNNPFPTDSKRVYDKEFEGTTFRIRVGGYRIFYGANYNKNLLLVHKIKKRPQAYVKEDGEL
ncbi:type II toxin-antitoxin system RelE/ParE family toxin [archaeon]|jgi:mRNA-degrading endonuclease RelE of RelBE toxin-antitoxin system|nr:type II toxin-antitoxin system RelE/ParE family toxin [archaeon]